MDPRPRVRESRSLFHPMPTMGVELGRTFWAPKEDEASDGVHQPPAEPIRRPGDPDNDRPVRSRHAGGIRLCCSSGRSAKDGFDRVNQGESQTAPLTGSGMRSYNHLHPTADRNRHGRPANSVIPRPGRLAGGLRVTYQFDLDCRSVPVSKNLSRYSSDSSSLSRARVNSSAPLVG